MPTKLISATVVPPLVDCQNATSCIAAVGLVDHACGIIDGREIDELGVVRVTDAAKSGHHAGVGSRIGLRILDFEPTGAGR